MFCLSSCLVTLRVVPRILQYEQGIGNAFWSLGEKEQVDREGRANALTRGIHVEMNSPIIRRYAPTYNP